MINSLFAWVLRDRKEVYLGDDNSLTLTFNAKNEGEGGAYEAELYVVLPPEADYSGIARNNEVIENAKHGENLQLPGTSAPLGTWLLLSLAVVWPICSLVSQSLTQLTCSYETENQTRYLSCDLGNPMKSGASVRTPTVLLLFFSTFAWLV